MFSSATWCTLEEIRMIFHYIPSLETCMLSNCILEHIGRVLHPFPLHPGAHWKSLASFPIASWSTLEETRLYSHCILEHIGRDFHPFPLNSKPTSEETCTFVETCMLFHCILDHIRRDLYSFPLHSEPH